MLRYNSGMKEPSRTLRTPVTAGRDDDGILVFEFADVRDSAQAWNVVDQDHWYFHGASKGFLPDPCARALETIKDDGLVGKTVSEKYAVRVEDGDETDGESTVVDKPASSFRCNGRESTLADTPAPSFSTTSADVTHFNQNNAGSRKGDEDKDLQSSVKCP